ncbi:MAG: hypothetical protein ABIO78_08065 [Thermoanaerobaculia bacterium]
MRSAPPPSANPRPPLELFLDFVQSNLTDDEQLRLLMQLAAHKNVQPKNNTPSSLRRLLEERYGRDELIRYFNVLVDRKSKGEPLVRLPRLQRVLKLQ